MEKTKHTLLFNLKALLEKREMSLNEFAEKTGMNYATALAIKNNKYRRIGLDTLQVMSEVLKCSISDLFIQE